MNNKGTSGFSGSKIHMDYRGYKRVRKWNKNTPQWMIDIFEFRNKNIREEWGKAMAGKHDISAYSSDENFDNEALINDAINLSNEVNEKLDEIEKKYNILDLALDEMEKGFKK